MPSEWRSCRLGDVVQIKTGNPFKSKDYSDASGAVRLLRGDNIAQGTLRWENAKGWHPSRVDEVSDYLLQTGDVVLAMDRPWIEAGLKYAAITPGDIPCLLVQRVACLRSKPDLDQTYLHYLIGSPNFTNYVLGIQTGTAVPHISSGQIQAFSFLLPPLDHQREAGSILRSLDDKITLLRETNATLEAIAQALFKSWFVDFDPVRAKAEGRDPEGVQPEVADLFPSEFEDSELGAIPKGWRVQTVENLADRVGMGPFGSNIKVSTFVEEGIPVISGQHLRGTLLEDSTFNFITEEHAHRLSGSIVGEGDVVFTHAGNIGQVALVPRAAKFKRYVLSQRQFFLRCNRTLIPPTWMTYFFRSPGGQHLLLANASQVGVPSIARPVSYLKSIRLVVPTPDIAHSFDEIAQTLLARIVCGRNESQNLTDLRDTLLPRLMSGKLCIPGGDLIETSS